MGTADLIGAARAVLETDPECEEFVEVVEHYVAAFGEWGGAEMKIDGAEAALEEVEELSILHQKVLDQVRMVADRTRGELQALSSRGKGIMAYLDVLPKRISITRPKKG